MDEIDMLCPGEFCWVEYDHGELRMIIAEHIYWSNEPDEQGWNIIYRDEEFYIESLRRLKHPIIAN